MMIRPLPGMQCSYVRTALAEAYTDTYNVYTAQHQSSDRLNAYFAWAHRTAGRLQNVVSAPDVTRLVLTPRYWALYSVAVATAAPVAEAINMELAARAADLKAGYEELDALAERWTQVTDATFVVADTNVFLQHENRLDTLDLAMELGVGAQPVHLAVPMAVLDELDKQKDRGQGRAKTNARTTIKLLDTYLKHPDLICEIRPADDSEEVAVPRGRFTVELLPDSLGHVPLSRSDDEIIDRALALQDLAGHRVTLVTGDIGMSMRARLTNLGVTRLDWPEPTPKPGKQSPVPSLPAETYSPRPSVAASSHISPSST
ncbi:PIN domain-containing protein [Embleya sp. NPDC127516]|uniref:PIN domain-containing protein n=1 Tax=Embleya sp. NPDC127516 TaxID=3363990 RepID=UPI003806E882